MKIKFRKLIAEEEKDIGVEIPDENMKNMGDDIPEEEMLNDMEELPDEDVEEINLEIFGDFTYSELEKFIDLYDEGLTLDGAELKLKINGRVKDKDEFIQKLEDEFQVRGL